jgi:uncharacterized membrane protein YwaF
MFLAIIMLFTKNKTIHSFVIIAGTLGVLVSLTYPVIGYDSHYYRYYQFMMAHGLLLIAPFYFTAVHGYLPSKKYVWNSFLILEGLTLFMLIFNYYNNTDFFFMFLDPQKIDKFPVIQYFGGIPYYIIIVEILAVLYFYGANKLFRRLEKRT